MVSQAHYGLQAFEDVFIIEIAEEALDVDSVGLMILLRRSALFKAESTSKAFFSSAIPPIKTLLSPIHLDQS